MFLLHNHSWVKKRNNLRSKKNLKLLWKLLKKLRKNIKLNKNFNFLNNKIKNNKTFNIQKTQIINISKYKYKFKKKKLAIKKIKSQLLIIISHLTRFRLLLLKLKNYIVLIFSNFIKSLSIVKRFYFVPKNKRFLKLKLLTYKAKSGLKAIFHIKKYLYQMKLFHIKKKTNYYIYNLLNFEYFNLIRQQSLKFL